MKKKIELKNLEMPRIYRFFYLISGVLLVVIGVIGIFLPVLPTTIFLILASACFLKSSTKAHQWLKNHRILGQYIKNYEDKTGLTVKAKIFNISFLWIMILLSAFYFTELTYIRIILIMIAIGVTIHLLTIKTLRK
jgi:uncharacterized membrane protein YbaN (DUF454 family)